MKYFFSSPGIDYASTSIGTPINICPEIVNGQAYDFKSDIWSLGCVTYELCSLKPAFQAGSIDEILSKIKSGSYPPIPTAFSTTLSDLIKVMLKVKHEMLFHIFQPLISKDFWIERIIDQIASQ